MTDNPNTKPYPKPEPKPETKPVSKERKAYLDSYVLANVNKTDEQLQADGQTLKTLQAEVDKKISELNAFKGSVGIPFSESPAERRERESAIAKARRDKRQGILTDAEKAARKAREDERKVQEARAAEARAVVAADEAKARKAEADEAKSKVNKATPAPTPERALTSEEKAEVKFSETHK